MFTQCDVSAKPEQENLNELKQELDIDFHKVPLAELYQRLGTNPDTGLTNSQVKHNQVHSSRSRVRWMQTSDTDHFKLQTLSN